MDPSNEPAYQLQRSLKINRCLRALDSCHETLIQMPCRLCRVQASGTGSGAQAAGAEGWGEMALALITVARASCPWRQEDQSEVARWRVIVIRFGWFSCDPRISCRRLSNERRTTCMHAHLYLCTEAARHHILGVGADQPQRPSSSLHRLWSSRSRGMISCVEEPPGSPEMLGEGCLDGVPYTIVWSAFGVWRLASSAGRGTRRSYQTPVPAHLDGSERPDPRPGEMRTGKAPTKPPPTEQRLAGAYG